MQLAYSIRYWYHTNMNENDQRLKAYRKAAGFNPEKLTADEVEKNNAAIAALLKSDTEAAIVQLQTGKKAEEKVQPAEFKPFSFADAPVFQSKEKESEISEKQKKQTPVAKTIEEAPAPKNQFDFAAFAAMNGGQAFQPKKFTAQPLDSVASTAPKAEKPEGGKNKSKDKSYDEILYKIPSGTTDSTYRRVAKFLLLIGVEQAAEVISYLPQEQVDKIVPEIASIRHVSSEEASQILAEFHVLIDKAQTSGGVRTARSILAKAFGEERAEDVMQKAVPFKNGTPFEYLKDLNQDKISFLLKDESAPVKALILSKIKPSVAAEVIKQMPEDDKKETIWRMARLTSFSPDILSRIDNTMREKVQTMQFPTQETIDGRNALAGILRKMDPDAGQQILSTLQNYDTDLEKDLRSRLFTMDDVQNADDKFIQKILHSMSDTDIAYLICDKTELFRKKIFTNISKTRGASVLEEESARKPVRKKDVNAVTDSFLKKLRTAWESGELIIAARDEDQWVE